jgi:hypothetical protein
MHHNFIYINTATKALPLLHTGLQQLQTRFLNNTN